MNFKLNNIDIKVIGGKSDNSISYYSLSSSTATNSWSTGHTGAVLALKRIDKNRYASGSADKNIKIWNSATGVIISTISGHTGIYNSVLPYLYNLLNL